MKKHLKMIVIVLAVVILGTGLSIPILSSSFKAQASDEAPFVMQEEQMEAPQEVAGGEEAVITSAEEAKTKSSKAMAAALVVGIAAAAGAISMGLAIAKSAEGTARQPEASSKIQTMLMLGLVFIETAIIYALIVAILIIFVL